MRKGCPHGCAIPVTAANILHLFLGCSAGVRVCFSRACFPLGDLGAGKKQGLIVIVTDRQERERERERSREGERRNMM